MKKWLCILLYVFPFCLWAQIMPTTIPTVKLDSLSLDELNQLFTEVNFAYKKKAINNFADSLCHKLNGSVLIAQNDEILVKKVSGYRKLSIRTEEGRISDTTRFELASVSKQFTAAAILQLVHQGKISLDNLLTQYFPQLPYYNITIRHLLTHTSGLPEYFNFKESWFPQNRLITNKDVLNVLAKYQPKIIYPVGTQFKYTNTNYALLVLIVEKVTGMTFEDYAQQNIFSPAGMTHTFYISQREKHPASSMATGHLKNGTAKKLHFMDGSIGDKGLYSTAEDLLLWEKAFFHEYKILPKEWVDAATQPENQLRNHRYPNELYGFGFRIENSPQFGRLVYHGGLWHGFLHLTLYNPQSRIYIVFLSNYRNGAHRGKSNEVLKILRGA